ncbi:hypothetical protein GJAV_G00192960 [Gymnothorax javanicus]|nr:hypothetical protein GJAV_G00192960 [Gymnothorax javanicus]
MFFPLYGTVLIFFSTAAQSSPEVHLTADPPWTAMFPGEKVTLTCQVIGSQGWMFSWIRLSRSGGTTQIQGFGADNSVLVLDSAAERHSGQYHCEAERLNEQVVSNVHSITVSAAPPQAVIVTDPPASEVFAGETVSLACIIEGSGWRYSWSRITQQRLESLSARSTDSQQKHVIDSVRESDGGTFLCQGERGQNPVIQSLPGSLVLNVSGRKPKPMITQNPLADTLYTGERVTLSCGFGVDSASWEYLWFKDSLKAAPPNTDRSGVSYTIRSAALHHSGQYHCLAARGTWLFYSDYSDPLTLHISDLPRAHLSVQSGWTAVFPNRNSDPEVCH